MNAILTETKTQIMVEEHIVLRGVSWNVYQQLMKEHEDRSAPRFTFNQGCLEIYMPSQKHAPQCCFGRSMSSKPVALATAVAADFPNIHRRFSTGRHDEFVFHKGHSGDFFPRAVRGSGLFFDALCVHVSTVAEAARTAFQTFWNRLETR